MNIPRHLKKIENKNEERQIRNIDFIYLINLDRRPEKLKRSLEQMAPFGIQPHRVPGIYGWDLTQEAFDDIGLKILRGMILTFPVHFHPSSKNDAAVSLDESCIGRTCVSMETTAGMLGSALSHLSVLQDAYDAGYETIWILEDDFTLLQDFDPHRLADAIDELDVLTQGKSWDILFTDDDAHFPPQPHATGKFRPDAPMYHRPFEHTPIGKSLFRITGKLHKGSMILRRSGIKKVIDSLKRRGLFRPYQLEIAFIPHIQLYSMNSGVAYGREATVSDSQEKCFL